MINSPLVRAEKLNFAEDGVHQVLRKVFIPWHSAFRFLMQNIQRHETATGKTFYYDEELVKKVPESYLD